ncbi:hypothetical protein HZB07_02540 [Candidatus Saganbacteria bacterium]|nr:hypothetical protein [Candidatus Saganbacteria bacterium]
MSQLNLSKIIKLLKKFTQESRTSLEIIIIGGLALSHYGLKGRSTVDIDGETKGDLDSLSNFLKSRKIPFSLGENISNWGIVSLSPGYRLRAVPIFTDQDLIVKVLDPVDFIIAKIRRFSEIDIKDALYVAKKFKIKPEVISRAAGEAIGNSPKDTALFIFKKNLALFIKMLRPVK